MDAAPKLAPEAQRPADTAQPSLELVPPSPPNPDRPPEQLLLVRSLELVKSARTAGGHLPRAYGI